MLQTSSTHTTAKSKQRPPVPTSRNPEPITVGRPPSLPNFVLTADVELLRKQMPEALAYWLKIASAEFLKLRDDPTSDNDAFDDAGGSRSRGQPA